MVRRALLALALLLPGAAAAESLTLSLVPHPRHETVVAGEMVPVTLRAVYDRKVARERTEIAPSTSFDWIQTGPDRWRDEMIDGKSWITMERPLVIVPKAAGLLHFGPATHTLTIIDDRSTRSDRTVVAPPLSLSVGAYPVERGWRWVADEVTLTDELSTDPARLVDGETVTRRVTLTAKGALPESLPPRPIVSEPWLITFAAPVERKLVLTDDGPVSEVVWVWQFRPETGEPGVLPAVTIPFFNATTREMDAVEIAPLPIAYASFYTSQVQTGRFGAVEQLGEAAALLAGFVAGGALILSRRAPDATRAGLARLRRRWSPSLRWQMRRAERTGDLMALRRLLDRARPEATEAAAVVERAIYRPGTAFDRAAFRRALRGGG